MSYVYVDSQIVASSAGDQYVYGPVSDQVLALSSGGTVSYYSAAALGSISLLTNGAGNVENSYLVDAWGGSRAVSGSVTNPFGYTGREFNDDGTYYYRARYYDSATGRFTKEDPSTHVGSLYQYASNNPISYRDPTGLSPLGDCVLWLKSFFCSKHGHQCDQAHPCYHGDPKVAKAPNPCEACIQCCAVCREYIACETPGAAGNGTRAAAIYNEGGCKTQCVTDVCGGGE